MDVIPTNIPSVKTRARLFSETNTGKRKNLSNFFKFAYLSKLQLLMNPDVSYCGF